MIQLNVKKNTVKDIKKKIIPLSSNATRLPYFSSWLEWNGRHPDVSGQLQITFADSKTIEKSV